MPNFVFSVVVRCVVMTVVSCSRLQHSLIYEVSLSFVCVFDIALAASQWYEQQGGLFAVDLRRSPIQPSWSVPWWLRRSDRDPA